MRTQVGDFRGNEERLIGTHFRGIYPDIAELKFPVSQAVAEGKKARRLDESRYFDVYFSPAENGLPVDFSR
ncbi:MAG: hypothetical protein HC845_14180 [Akkermansiaceae bacterium]|nr:hypothetical protein [Akkermansiaceae bacterium]